MNIKIISFVDEIEIQYNKRVLSYCRTGYSYWYDGKEKSNNLYSRERWKKVLEKYNNSHSCCIKYNENYNYEQAILFDKLIRQSVLKDKEDVKHQVQELFKENN